MSVRPATLVARTHDPDSTLVSVGTDLPSSQPVSSTRWPMPPGNVLRISAPVHPRFARKLPASPQPAPASIRRPRSQFPSGSSPTSHLLAPPGCRASGYCGFRVRQESHPRCSPVACVRRLLYCWPSLTVLYPSPTPVRGPIHLAWQFGHRDRQPPPVHSMPPRQP